MKVAFFIHNGWAFGSIHRALCKEFYLRGIFATIIDWTQQYTLEEFDSFNQSFDYFMTTPGNAITCLNNMGVSNSKIIAVAHAEWDIDFGLSEGNKFDEFATYAVIAPELIDMSAHRGITRIPKLVQNGIHFEWFYQKINSSLNTIGYAAKMQTLQWDGVTERKRGYLVERVAKELGIPFRPIDNRNFLGMPAYYKTVDCVMMSSIEEACGLSMMEGAAAGKMILGTNVGCLKTNPKAGFILPFEDEDYVMQAKDLINLAVSNPHLYRDICKNNQDYAREHYDWKHVIGDWINLLPNSVSSV